MDPLLAAAARDLDEGILVVDSGGRVVFANSAAGRIFDLGTLQADIRDHSFPFLQADRRTPIPRERLPFPRALRGEEVPDDELFLPGEGEGRWLRGSARAIRDAAGRVTGAVCIFRDVTARKRQEEALLALTRAPVVLLE